MQRNFDYYLVEDKGPVGRQVAGTSRECFRDIRDEGLIGKRHSEYLRALWDRNEPSTDQEVTKSVGKSDPNYFRPRRKELLDRGFLVLCNDRICGVTGRTAHTFWFTSMGLEALRI